MAATTGLLQPSMASCTATRLGSCEGLPNSEMSAPAMKVRPAQISTAARAEASASTASNAAFSPARTLAESAFTGGESRVTTATPSSIARSVTSLIAVMGVLSGRAFAEGHSRPEARAHP